MPGVGSLPILDRHHVGNVAGELVELRLSAAQLDLLEQRLGGRKMQR